VRLTRWPSLRPDPRAITADPLATEDGFRADDEFGWGYRSYVVTTW